MGELVVLVFQLGRWPSSPRVERCLPGFPGVDDVYGGALDLNGVIRDISFVYAESWHSISLV